MTQSQDHRWRPALVTLAVLLGWILFLYRETGLAMATIWERSETFTHGFVVPPIVLWLIWRKRSMLRQFQPRPSFGALPFVALAGAAWLLGELVSVNSVVQLAFTALLVLAVPTVLGIRVTRAITFPLGFLFFAVPIGEFLLPQLMEWTANFTIIALRMSGIPVYREGLQFVIPSGSWSVVEACSGVRYLIASLSIGTLFAYLNFQSNKRRLLFVLVSILVPIVANWMRAYMIVMLGHLSGNKLAVGVDHLIYGWVFFGIVILLMFMIGARWSEPEPPFTAGAALSPAVKTASAARIYVAGVCLAVVVALPVAAKWALERHSTTDAAAVSLIAPDASAVGWQSSDAAAIGFKPVFEKPSAEINVAYGKAEKTVGLYLAFYQHQDYQSKLVSSNNVIVLSEDKTWSRVASATQVVAMGQQPVTVRSAELRRLPAAAESQTERLVVWQIYWINGTLTASDYVAKAYSALYQLMGRGDDSAVIIVYAPKGRDGDVDAALRSFMAENYGAIDAALRQAGRGK